MKVVLTAVTMVVCKVAVMVVERVLRKVETKVVLMAAK